MQMEQKILGFLQEINERLNHQNEKLNKQNEKINLLGETLKEHGSILVALRSGQEASRAEISEMRLQNAKDFGEMREQMKTIEVSVEVLKEESWSNKIDIRRVQKTMGMI